MSDLDPALRSLARALTESAPPPPPFPSDTAKRVSHGRRSIFHFAAAAAAAVAIVGVAGTAMFVSATTQQGSSLRSEITRPRSPPCRPISVTLSRPFESSCLAPPTAQP